MSSGYISAALICGTGNVSNSAHVGYLLFENSIKDSNVLDEVLDGLVIRCEASDYLWYVVVKVVNDCTNGRQDFFGGVSSSYSLHGL